MPTANDLIAYTLAATQQMLTNFCQDLTPQEYLHRPCTGGNAAAWLVGHLILTERHLLTRAGVTDLPPLPDGFEKRFSREPEAPKASDFGDVSILLPLFTQHRQLLIDAVRKLPSEILDKPLDKPHPRFKTTGELLSFLGGPHVAMHAGQITIIRRSLGRPPLM
jgi:hypothetical protein